jgi:hypothetical protein
MIGSNDIMKWDLLQNSSRWGKNGGVQKNWDLLKLGSEYMGVHYTALILFEMFP